MPTLDPVALLDALFEGGFDADFNVFWNVRFDFGAIVKPWLVARAPVLKTNHLRKMRVMKEVALLDAKLLVEDKPKSEDRIRRRALKREADELESVERFAIGPYRVLYIPKKGFRLTRIRKQRGRNSVVFFDAAQFYATASETASEMSEAASLDKAARKYLGEHKTAEEEGISREEIGSDVAYYDAHRDAIVRYCRQDSGLTARLFARVVDAFEAIGAPFPKQPWSRASVGREYLKRTGVLEGSRGAYRRLSASGHARLWEKAYAGACIHTRGLGAWPDTHRLDENSAYPAAMIEFPSLEGAFLVDRSDARFDGCYFKFYEVLLTPTPRRALPARDGGPDRLLYVEGGTPRRVCVTAIDLELFDAFGDRYEILDAVGVFTPSEERPLSYMRTLFESKSAIKRKFGENSVEYQNVKVMLASTYGILTQSRPRAGRYTNFIYGSYITAHTRRALWLKAQECERRGGTVLAFMTDGLFVADLADPPEPSKTLGGWDVVDEGLVVLFANGIYLAGGHLKKRGAPDLTTDALMNTDGTTITTRKARPFGLKQGIIQAHPERVGVFLDEEKELYPAAMADGAGLVVPKDLMRAPLRSYFTRRWLLSYRPAFDVKPARRGPPKDTSREAAHPAAESDL